MDDGKHSGRQATAAAQVWAAGGTLHYGWRFFSQDLNARDWP